jgi:hypothetical protein
VGDGALTVVPTCWTISPTVSTEGSGRTASPDGVGGGALVMVLVGWAAAPTVSAVAGRVVDEVGGGAKVEAGLPVCATLTGDKRASCGSAVGVPPAEGVGVIPPVKGVPHVVGEAASSGVEVGGSEGADGEVESPTHVWFLPTSSVLCCKIKELAETSPVWVSGDAKNTEEGWIGRSYQ